MFEFPHCSIWILCSLALFPSLVVADGFQRIGKIPIAAIFGIFVATVVLVLCCRFLCRARMGSERHMRWSHQPAPVTIVTQTGPPLNTTPYTTYPTANYPRTVMDSPYQSQAPSYPTANYSSTSTTMPPYPPTSTNYSNTTTTMPPYPPTSTNYQVPSAPPPQSYMEPPPYSSLYPEGGTNQNK